jgi:protein PhnA
MSLEKQLRTRAADQCELCHSHTGLKVLDIQPNDGPSVENSALICQSCAEKIVSSDTLNPGDWRFIADSMWSTVDPVV